MTVNNFQDLLVWQKAMDLTVSCYKLCLALPDSERYGLKSQIERAAVSIPANIAEGHGLGTPKQFVKHIWIANGSSSELQTHLLLGQRLGYFDSETVIKMLDRISEIGRMVTGLRRSLNIDN